MIWITQCLCPKRHCIIACAWDEAMQTKESAEALLKEAVETLIAAHDINGHCGICLNTVFNYESERTRFNTMEEAAPTLARMQLENLITGARLQAENRN
jgi:hypothetical protein